MDDARFVTRFERVRHLLRDGDGFFDRNGALRDSLRQRGAFDELERERFDTVGFLKAIDACDVRMVQRREELGFALEPSKSLFVLCELVRQDFDRDFAIELRVTCAVHLAHPTFADRRANFIGSQPSSGVEGHGKTLPAAGGANKSSFFDSYKSR